MANPETTSSFGYWVRRRRLAMDLTQADLARAVSCATVTITKIERDERRPSHQMATLLADRLAIPPHERDRFLAVALGETAVDRLLLDGTPLAAPAVPAAPPSNLPVPATPFVGRQSELSQLSARLVDPACRLLTLLGAGGFGKTRLAIRLGELALAQPARFPDGVFFVPLDGVEAAEFVVPAIAAALTFTFYAQEDETKQLFHYLAAKRLLLILDNAETVLAPDLVARLLAHARHVTVLVTTREALNLQEEWLNPIGGMAVDEPDAVGTDAAQPATADAIMLFHQCALRAQPAFDLPRVLNSVQRICGLVDGAPLAIELAAAWLKVLTCDQVAQQLAHDSDLLDTALHHMPARHRSMRAVLAQSWHYLSADEQQVFRRLAVFEGGFRLAAAQAVVDAPLPVLAALAGKSMLHLAPDGRYRTHDLLRQFAAEQLAAVPAELAGCRTRHAAYFMDFLAERSEELTGAGQMVARREIQDEMANIHAAWSYLAGEGHFPPQGALRALFRFLWTRGRYQEGEQMASQTLEGVDSAQLTAEEQTVRVALMIYRAQFADAKGESADALIQVEAACVEAERIGSLAEQAHGYYVTGRIETFLLNAARTEAAEHLRHAVELYRHLDNDLGIAEATYWLAYVQGTLRDDPESALRMLEESLAILRRLGDVSLQADALNNLGHVAWVAGTVDRSEQAYRQSLAAALATDNRLVAAQAIGGLGLVAWARADWDQAIALMEQRFEMTQQLGHRPQVQNSLMLLCVIYAQADRYPDAIALMHAHPEMWHTAWLALAQAGAGMYDAVMSYLPQLTEKAILADTFFREVSLLLIAWALLLEGECTLQTGKETPVARILSRAERRALAEEILSAVAIYPPTDPATRAHAKHLLARVQEQTRAEPAGEHQPPKPLRSIEDLTRQVLTISLA